MKLIKAVPSDDLLKRAMAQSSQNLINHMPMNYKEKAVQLVESFNKVTDRAGAIMCVDIMCDEVIKIVPSVYLTDDNKIHSGHRQYWEGIKNELFKLKQAEPKN